MMWTDAILAYLHFGAIFTLVWFLAKAWTLLRAGAAAVDTERLARADLAFGLAAAAVLATGALRAGLGIKGWAFYAHNPVFHAKIGVFLVAGLVSIAPTRAFLRWRRQRRADPQWAVPAGEWNAVRRWMMIELHLLAIVPLAAAIMARGLR